jgi:hypothetical protein
MNHDDKFYNNGNRTTPKYTLDIIKKRPDYWGDLDIGWKIILKWFVQNGRDGIVWIHLTKDRNQWRALINTVMKILVPYIILKLLSN